MEDMARQGTNTTGNLQLEVMAVTMDISNEFCFYDTEYILKGRALGW